MIICETVKVRHSNVIIPINQQTKQNRAPEKEKSLKFPSSATTLLL